MPDDPNRTGPYDPRAAAVASGPRASGLHSTIDVTGGSNPESTFSPESADGPVPALPPIPGYTLTGEIARGGMGRVLAAHDLSFDREVAIKVLLPTTSRAAASRFITESKITGRLPHPGVPPVHALGELDGIGPYLVMKRVRGRTLADLLTSRQAVADDLPRWMGVFEQVCQAVGFAHSQGILHRDLKPANVMVGDFGETYVMDSGLAKEQASERDEGRGEDDSEAADAREAFHTVAGTVLGTPSFMAPEQARGEPLDTRADVFALGGILSVILTGKPVFTGNSSAEVVGKAASGSVMDAVARLDHCGADAELIGLAKRCLSPSPQDRPTDAQAVAESVAAYRAGVEDRLREARAERAAADARAAEQGKRRRLMTAAAAVVIAVLLTGGAAAGWQWLRARNALTRVTEEQGRTQEALQDLTASRDRNVRNLLKVTRELVPDVVSRKAVLTEQDKVTIRGLLQMWQEVVSNRGDDEASRALQAEGHYQVGFLQHSLGQWQEAAREYREALTMLEALAAEFSANRKYRSDLVVVHNNLGNVFENLGKSEDAEGHHRHSLAMSQALSVEAPDETVYRLDQARAIFNLALRSLRLGRREESAVQFQQSLALREAAAATDPAAQMGAAESHMMLGIVLIQSGEKPKAEAHFRRAADQSLELSERFPNEVEYLLLAGRMKNNVGSLLVDLDRPEEGLKEYRTALELKTRIAKEYPAIPEYRADLARTCNNMGLILNKSGQREEAERMLRQALTVRESLAADFPDSHEHRSSVARTHTSLGPVLVDLGRHAEAEKEYEKALEGYTKLAAQYPRIPEHRLMMALTHKNRGDLFLDLGRAQEAETSYLETLSLWSTLGKPPAQYPRVIPECHFGLARASAGISAKASDPVKKKEHADRAVARLRDALKAGWNDLEAIATDPNWNLLRDRDDVRQLLPKLGDTPAVAPPPRERR